MAPGSPPWDLKEPWDHLVTPHGSENVNGTSSAAAAAATAAVTAAARTVSAAAAAAAEAAGRGSAWSNIGLGFDFDKGFGSSAEAWATTTIDLASSIPSAIKKVSRSNGNGGPGGSPALVPGGGGGGRSDADSLPSHSVAPPDRTTVVGVTLTGAEAARAAAVGWTCVCDSLDGNSVEESRVADLGGGGFGAGSGMDRAGGSATALVSRASESGSGDDENGDAFDGAWVKAVNAAAATAATAPRGETGEAWQTALRATLGDNSMGAWQEAWGEAEEGHGGDDGGGLGTVEKDIVARTAEVGVNGSSRGMPGARLLGGGGVSFDLDSVGGGGGGGGPEDMRGAWDADGGGLGLHTVPHEGNVPIWH